MPLHKVHPHTTSIARLPTPRLPHSSNHPPSETWMRLCIRAQAPQWEANVGADDEQQWMLILLHLTKKMESERQRTAKVLRRAWWNLGIKKFKCLTESPLVFLRVMSASALLATQLSFRFPPLITQTTNHGKRCAPVFPFRARISLLFSLLQLWLFFADPACVGMSRAFLTCLHLLHLQKKRKRSEWWMWK